MLNRRHVSHIVRTFGIIFSAHVLDFPFVWFSLGFGGFFLEAALFRVKKGITQSILTREAQLCSSKSKKHSCVSIRSTLCAFEREKHRCAFPKREKHNMCFPKRKKHDCAFQKGEWKNTPVLSFFLLFSFSFFCLDYFFVLVFFLGFSVSGF